MESFHVSANAECVTTPEVTQITFKFQSTSIMYISDMTFHICLVQTLIRAESASKMRAFWIHLATILYVATQQRLQRIGFFAKRASVSLLHNLRRRPLSWHHSNFIQLIVMRNGTFK